MGDINHLPFGLPFQDDQSILLPAPHPSVLLGYVTHPPTHPPYPLSISIHPPAHPPIHPPTHPPTHPLQQRRSRHPHDASLLPLHWTRSPSTRPRSTSYSKSPHTHPSNPYHSVAHSNRLVLLYLPTAHSTSHHPPTHPPQNPQQAGHVRATALEEVSAQRACATQPPPGPEAHHFKQHYHQYLRQERARPRRRRKWVCTLIDLVRFPFEKRLEGGPGGASLSTHHSPS